MSILNSFKAIVAKPWQLIRGMQTPTPAGQQQGSPVALDPNEEHLEEHATIALFGAHSAGKTTFIQAICAQSIRPELRNNPANKIVIHPVGNASQIYLLDLDVSYMKGHFPAPTKDEKELFFYIQEEDTSSSNIFKIMDPPGEWLEPSQYTKNAEYNKVKEFVKDADCIYFFIEPNSFLDLLLLSNVQQFLSNHPNWYVDRFNSLWGVIENEISSQITNEKKLGSFLANFPINLDLVQPDGEISQAAQAILNHQSSDNQKLNLLQGLFMDHLLLSDFGSQQVNLQAMYWGPDQTPNHQIIPNATGSIKKVNQLWKIADVLNKNPTNREDLLIKLLKKDNYTALKTVANGLVNFIVANIKRQISGQPIALIIPKCDQIPGFKDSNPLIQLIPKELDDLKYILNFNDFKNELINHWRATLDNQLIQVIDALFNAYNSMISILLMNKMDFQIFFVTGVGEVVFDRQAGKYRPPTEPRPRGVREPLAWFTQRCRRGTWAKRRIQVLFRWGVAGIVFMALPVYLHVYSKKLDGVLIGGSVDETALMSLSGWPMLGTGDLKEIMALVRKHQSMVSLVKGFRDSLICEGTPNQIRKLLDNKIFNEFKRYSQELPVCRNRRIVEIGQMIAQLEQTKTTLNDWNRDGIRFRFPDNFDIGEGRKLKINEISPSQDLTWKPDMSLTIKVDPNNIGGWYSQPESIPKIDLLDPSKSIMLTVVQQQTKITENIPLSLAFLHDSFCHTLREAMPPIPTY